MKEMPEIKNSNIEDIEDIPKEEVERKDGLPTVEDLKEIKEEDKVDSDDESDGIFGKARMGNKKRVMINIQICGDGSDADPITEFLQKILGK